MGIPRLSPFVGYAQNGLKNGATMVAPQFLNIGSEGAMPLVSLTPTGSDLSDNVAVQTLDAAGYTVDNYMWVDWMGDDPCWIDGDFNVVDDTVTFAPGQGLWVYGSDSSQGFQSAGKVGTSDVVVTLRNGATGAGNPFPVALALNDILPAGSDLSDNVAVQTLDAAGYTVDNYMWVDWMGDDPCWIDGDFNIVDDTVTFEPGQGLWVYGTSSDQSIRFPAPTL